MDALRGLTGLQGFMIPEKSSSPKQTEDTEAELCNKCLSIDGICKSSRAPNNKRGTKNESLRTVWGSSHAVVQEIWEPFNHPLYSQAPPASSWVPGQDWFGLSIDVGAQNILFGQGSCHIFQPINASSLKLKSNFKLTVSHVSEAWYHSEDQKNIQIQHLLRVVICKR